ncbi:hydroxyacid dehydrogenase [Isoptericola halotolerans]|uniref:Phosphoglycerate dehydrogenase-like enzyme n=1 Tax=Isoptericola halotolerans TaxID=300560 RepID=A0ABX1ZZ49_9MICO|nr:hydroxyacid dehydrogenase [Isoptericola halotolerans]NOV95751.1 phosphoglycerate dehydrogenase-like enzyme [Isoptericola halotolerans]
MRRLHAAFALRDQQLLSELFDNGARARLSAVADVAGDVVTTADGRGADHVLRDVEVLVTGWGPPRLDDAFLARTPRLRAVVHTAGTVKSFVTDAIWERGIEVSSAAWANARPVAEYTLAMILLAGKRVLESAADYGRTRSLTGRHLPPHGNHGLVVGIVGASRTGRQVMELLAPFDIDVLLHDPFVDAAGAQGLGATAVGLDELLRRSEVVSLHAPSLSETYRMVGARELALMRDHSTLLNTARGQLVDTEALTTEVLAGRLRAILDVTDPEPLPADHPLHGAPGVLLTPHVAGSSGNELRRLGASAVAEIERLAAGLELAHPVRREHLARTA